MNEQQKPPRPEETRSASAEAWQEVGKQFQALGETLAAALRTSVKNEENRRRLQEMQAGLEKMVQEVGKAIQETASSPHVQQLRTETGKTAQKVVSASEQTVQDIRPHVLTALRQLNAELQRLVGRMEAEKGEPPKKAENPPDETRS